MASYTITGTSVFPEGTSLAVYPVTSGTGYGDNPPIGPAAATGTISSGAVTFTSLADGTAYVAAGQVSGKYRYITFVTNPVTRFSYILNDAETEADAATVSEALDVLTRTPNEDVRNVVTPGAGADARTLKSSTATPSRQNPDYITPSGTEVFKLDTNGYFTLGPNELYDKTPGNSKEITDFAWDPRARTLWTRSIVQGDIGDPVDLQQQRAGSPTTRVAQALTFPDAGPLYVAYAGPAFASAGELDVNGIEVTYTAKANHTTTTTTGGAQTVNRDGGATVTLNVTDASGFLTGGVRYARCGEEIIKYVGTGSGTLLNVALITDARTSVSIPDGSTVSQDKFTGLSGGSGATSAGDVVEQNIYPVPDSLDDIPSDRTPSELGHWKWRGWKTDAGYPEGSKGGAGWGPDSAKIFAFAAEPIRSTRAGGNIVCQTTPLGSTTLTNRLEILHDGGVRIGPSTKIGTNALDKTTLGRLSVEGEDANLNVLTLKSAAAQVSAPLKILDSADANVFRVTPGGGLGVGNSEAGSTLGTVVKKVQIFNASGSSLGYLPVYDAIT